MAALKLEQVFSQFPQKTFTISALVKSRKNFESYLEIDYAFLTATKTLGWTTVISVRRVAFDKVGSHGAQAMTSKTLIVWIVHARVDNHTGSTCNGTHGAGLPGGPYQVCHHHSTQTTVIVMHTFNFSTKFSQSFYHNLRLAENVDCLNLQ